MSDSEFELLIHDDEELELTRDSKCDNCNPAMHDCSLCGVGWSDFPYPDTPIC